LDGKEIFESRNMDHKDSYNGFIVAVFIGRDIDIDPGKLTYMPGIYPGKVPDGQGGEKPVELTHGALVPVPTDPVLYDRAVRSGQFAKESLHDQVAKWLGEGKTGAQIYELAKEAGGLLIEATKPAHTEEVAS
jgi:hypothetical protein